MSKNHRTFPKRECDNLKYKMLNAHINIEITFQNILLWKYNIRSWFWFYYCKRIRDKFKSTEYHYIKYDVRGEGEERKQLKKASSPSCLKATWQTLTTTTKSSKDTWLPAFWWSLRTLSAISEYLLCCQFHFLFKGQKLYYILVQQSITKVGSTELRPTHSFPLGNYIRMLQVLQIHINSHI